jgi:hypothetical protein
MIIENLLAAITFHYDKNRLTYLEKVCRQIPSLAFNYKVIVVTNTQDENSLNEILDRLKGLTKLELVVRPQTSHPYFLTWAHHPIFKQQLTSDSSFSHYMYLEDDIFVTARNINYWLRGRHELQNSSFYPSFVRYEINQKNCLNYATDITKSLRFNKLPHVIISTDYAYCSSPQPYQGMYLMDQKMLREYYNSPAYSPDFGNWNIREKATQGLTFLNVPNKFFSRNLIGCSLFQKSIDPDALIEHLPANYANDENSPFGKILIAKLIKI